MTPMTCPLYLCLFRAKMKLFNPLLAILGYNFRVEIPNSRLMLQVNEYTSFYAHKNYYSKRCLPWCLSSKILLSNYAWENKWQTPVWNRKYGTLIAVTDECLPYWEKGIKHFMRHVYENTFKKTNQWNLAIENSNLCTSIKSLTLSHSLFCNLIIYILW